MWHNSPPIQHSLFTKRFQVNEGKRWENIVSCSRAVRHALTLMKYHRCLVYGGVYHMMQLMKGKKRKWFQVVTGWCSTFVAKNSQSKALRHQRCWFEDITIYSTTWHLKPTVTVLYPPNTIYKHSLQLLVSNTVSHFCHINTFLHSIHSNKEK